MFRIEARSVVTFSMVALCALGLTLLAVSFLDYEFIKHQADRYSTRGNATLISPVFYASLVLRLRIFAFVLLVCSIPVYLARYFLVRFTESFVVSIQVLAKEAWLEVKSISVEPRSVRLVLVVLMLSGVLLRLNFIQEPLRFDESWTFLSFVQMPAAYIPLRYDAPNNHILHTLLIKLSTAVNGDSEWAIRLPAFVFGVLVLPAAFLLFRKLYGVTAGLFALSLIATSSPLVEYSVNARGYSTITFAFLMMLLVGDYAFRHHSMAGYTLVAVIGALGAFTVPIMVLASATVWAWLGLRVAFAESRAPRLQGLSQLVLAGLGMTMLTLLLYTPVFAVNGPSVVANTMLASTSKVVKTSLQFAGELFVVWHRDYPDILSILIVLGVIVAVVVNSRLSQACVPLFVVAALIFEAQGLVLHDFGFRRVWLFVLPVYLGTAAAGLSFALDKGLGLLAMRGTSQIRMAALLALVLCTVSGLLVVSSGSVAASTETGIFPAVKDAIQIIKQKAREDDLVAVDSYYGSMQFAYYARRADLGLIPLGDIEEKRVYAISNTTARNSEPGRRIFFVNNLAMVPTPPSIVAGVPPTFSLKTQPTSLHHSSVLDIYSALIQPNDQK